MKTRYVIVTGASSGIGRELARVFAKQGAHVGLLCRSPSRGEQTVQAFSQDMDASRCSVLACDLASMASVRQVAASIVSAGRPVDTLMLNAGVFGLPFQLTSEGFETTYASNYLGHFALVHLLADAGMLAPEVRIVSTQTSAVHANPFAGLDLEMLEHAAQSAARFTAFKASPGTKVMLALMALEFTRRKADTTLHDAKFVGVSPGGVRTENVNQMGEFARRVLVPLFGGVLLRPVEEGVAPLLWAATSPEVESGAVYDKKCRRVKLNRASSEMDGGQRLWELGERLLQLPAWPKAQSKSASAAAE